MTGAVHLSFPSSKIAKVVALLAIIGVGAIASWAALDTAFHATGDYEFCTGCHAYEPIARAYREDLHGGNNPAGVRAACNDCHLPYGNSLHYFIVKARHGIVDPTMALIREPHEIDWHALREERERFVYDSGCLGCHKYLAETSAANSKAFRPHRSYFAGETEKQCVSCHKHVGHNRLGYHLENLGWKQSPQGATP